MGLGVAWIPGHRLVEIIDGALTVVSVQLEHPVQVQVLRL
jgi:hypothetical protein